MFDTTMTGSFYRTKEIENLLKQSSTGEVGSDHENDIKEAERLAISDQLHPLGSETGLSWVSNGEQRNLIYCNPQILLHLWVCLIQATHGQGSRPSLDFSRYLQSPGSMQESICS